MDPAAGVETVIIMASMAERPLCERYRRSWKRFTFECEVFPATFPLSFPTVLLSTISNRIFLMEGVLLGSGIVL